MNKETKVDISKMKRAPLLGEARDRFARACSVQFTNAAAENVLGPDFHKKLSPPVRASLGLHSKDDDAALRQKIGNGAASLDSTSLTDLWATIVQSIQDKNVCPQQSAIAEAKKLFPALADACGIS
jgi:hypothetical protein